MVSFDRFRAPGLPIELGGVTYTLAPPTVERAAQQLDVVLVIGHKMRLYEREPTVETMTRYRALSNQDVEEIALGDIYQRMVDDGVPARDIARVAVYALFFWVEGAPAADAIAEAMWLSGGADDPKASGRRKRSTSGPNTASASRTKTASTRTTGSRTTSNRGTANKAKAATSTGPTSPTTGTTSTST